MAFGTRQWMNLGTQPRESTLRRTLYWFYVRGEALMDRIEYEEWGLKGVVAGRGVEIAKPGERQEKVEVRPSSRRHLLTSRT